MLIVRSVTLAAAILAVSCASSPAPPPPPSSPATVTSSELAEFPFSAREIHDSCKVGHALVFKVEGAGKPTTMLTIRFVSTTDDDAGFETTVTDADGHVIEGPASDHARWDELRHHASFPRDKTTITDDTITTPAGTFAARVYTVRRSDDEVSKFYFAKSLPGPPVLFFTDKSGARASTSTLQAVGDSPANTAPIALDALDAMAAEMPEVAALSKMRASYSPSFSSDGKRVFFLSNRSGVPELWSVATSGGEATAITHSDDPVTDFAVSPDGKTLAVAIAPGGGLNGQVWLMQSDGSGAKRITAGGKENNFLHKFSRDGKRLAYGSNARDPRASDGYLYDVAKGEGALAVEGRGLDAIVDMTRDVQRVLVQRLKTRGNEDLTIVDLKRCSRRTTAPATSWGAPSPRTRRASTSAATSGATGSRSFASSSATRGRRLPRCSSRVTTPTSSR